MTDEPWLEGYVPQHGRTFIDVGANHGAWSLWLRNYFEVVHAIEPYPGNWGYLTGKNIVLHRVAAWGSYQELVFGQGPRDCLIPDDVSNYFGKADQVSGFYVCLPIDIMGIRKVDFMKIDTEGAETQVIFGALKTITAWRPPMIIEIHHADNDERIRALLPTYDYEVIRNPHYQPSDPRYQHHYWLVAEPK